MEEKQYYFLYFGVVKISLCLVKVFFRTSNVNSLHNKELFPAATELVRKLCVCRVAHLTYLWSELTI